MNSTWLPVITSELANQCAQKALFIWMVYTNQANANQSFVLRAVTLETHYCKYIWWAFDVCYGCLLLVFLTISLPALLWFQQMVNKKNAKYKFWKRGNDIDFSCDCQTMMSRIALHWFMEYEYFIISLLYIIMWRHLQTTGNIHCIYESNSGLGYSLQNNTFQDMNHHQPFPAKIHI